jgi:hypothetical protein
MRRAGLPYPDEAAEQKILAGWLDSRRYGTDRLAWFHVPNGRKRSRRVGAILKREGVKKGVLDNFVIDPPPKKPGYVGTVCELKRVGATPSATSAHQLIWITRLERRGWFVFVAKGAGDAIRRFTDLGY